MFFIIRHFWRTLSFALAFFGIFWLPKDISDFNDAVRPWSEILSYIDREDAVWIVALLVFIWLFWSELKPALKEISLPGVRRKSYKGLYSAKLVFEVDKATLRLRRLENDGIFRYFSMPDGTGKMLLFLAFEQDTATEIVTITANDGSRAHYEILDASPRSLIVRFNHGFTLRGYTIECLLPLSIHKRLPSLYVESAPPASIALPSIKEGNGATELPRPTNSLKN